MKYVYAAFFLLAGLGLINIFAKIAMTFWPNDMLLIFVVGCAFVSIIFDWIKIYMESK